MTANDPVALFICDRKVLSSISVPRNLSGLDTKMYDKYILTAYQIDLPTDNASAYRALGEEWLP